MSVMQIVKVAQFLGICDIDELITLETEWRLLQLKTTTLDGEMKKDSKMKVKIDSYWLEIFNLQDDDGSPKFPLVQKTVKAAFSLSHGNSDVERNFSISGYLMPNESSKMKENTLSNLLTVRSHLTQCETTVESFVVTNELMQSAKAAGINYQLQLDEEKNKREVKKAKEEKKKEAEEAALEKKKKLEKEKLDLEKKEEELMSLKEKETDDLNAATHLFNEAQLKLQRAIKAKNFDEVRVASCILEGATTLQSQAILKRKAVDRDSFQINKKKNSLITSFFNKK